MPAFFEEARSNKVEMSEAEEHAKEESPYAGRWVAKLQGRVIAQAGTPSQARHAAQSSRPKEKAEILYMPPAVPLTLPPLVERVHSALPEQEIYLVGGAVRDALLGKLSHDLDFVVPGNAISVARRVANILKADFYVLDEGFDAARVIVTGQLSLSSQDQPADDNNPTQVDTRAGRDILDFTSFRAGPATGEPATLEGDLRARDFAINAIAYDMRTDSILDPMNGGADLRARAIRACSPSAMDEDSIRILRGVRLAAALDFKIEAATREAMKIAVGRLPQISPERQRDELFKILEGKRPDAAVRALELLGTFPYLMPELRAMKGVQQSTPHVADVWEHTLSTIQHLESILGSIAGGYNPEKNNDLLTGLLSGRKGSYRAQFASHLGHTLNPERSVRGLLFFAALFHDVSKPETGSVEVGGRIRFIGHDVRGAEVAMGRAKAFNLSNDEVVRLTTIIKNHMRFHFHVNRLEREGKEPSRKAIYRFFRDAGEAGIDLILLGLADVRGTRGHTLTQETWIHSLHVARIFLENYWEKPEESVAPPRLIDGNDLMAEYKLQSGRVIGELLETIREAQATGQISTRAEALELGRAWLRTKK